MQVRTDPLKAGLLIGAPPGARAAVSSVDVPFVGPGDLSTAMRSIGPANAPAVQDAIGSVPKTAAAVGKPLAAGFTMVAVGPDLGLLARGPDAHVASFEG